MYPADTNLPTYEIDLNEAYEYAYIRILEQGLEFDVDLQHIQVYPENSDFVISEY